PRDGLVRLDPKLGRGDLAAVESHPLRSIEPPPADQDAPAIARQDVPEDLRAEPRAAVLPVARAHEEGAREPWVDGAAADARPAENVRALPRNSSIHVADRASGA